MRAYRLIKERYVDNPLDAQGAKIFGGRWNSKGLAAVYASDSIALSALEILVHLHRNDILNYYCLCEITLPEEALMVLAKDTLPDGWQDDPPSATTQMIGDEWLQSKQSLVLSVPSTVVPQQSNLLINPEHDDFPALSAAMIVRPFVFDPRLRKK